MNRPALRFEGSRPFMKIASALFTLVVISAMTHLALAEDLAQGFAGIPWGASIETVDGLQETARSENTSAAENPTPSATSCFPM